MEISKGSIISKDYNSEAYLVLEVVENGKPIVKEIKENGKELSYPHDIFVVIGGKLL